MKMHKATRMFSLLLAGLMAVSLTSCGDDAGGNSSPGGSDSNSAGSSQQEESLYYNRKAIRSVTIRLRLRLQAQKDAA